MKQMWLTFSLSVLLFVLIGTLYFFAYSAIRLPLETMILFCIVPISIFVIEIKCIKKIVIKLENELNNKNCETR